MISDKPIGSLGIVDCPVYTRRIALKDDYNKKRMDMLACTPAMLNYLETPAINQSRQNDFIQEHVFNKAPVRLIDIAMNKNS